MRVSFPHKRGSTLILRLTSLLGTVVSLGLLGHIVLAEPIAAKLGVAPHVPPLIARQEPAHIVIKLAIEEKVGELSEGVQYEFWTYNGSVPGPFIRLRQGDTLEVHLDNTKGKLTHTVDFHAVTGPGGEANALMADPGKRVSACLRPSTLGSLSTTAPHRRFPPTLQTGSTVLF